ncbi:MAG: amidohydrolase family protein, partial [Phycisphaerae bacterium]|nr:amidohydrolase family protein [Phycisphaerae bacterium]
MPRYFLPSLAVTLAVLFAAPAVCEAQNYGVAKDLARKAVRAAEGKRPAEPEPQKPKRPSTKPTKAPPTDEQTPPEIEAPLRADIREGVAEMPLIDAHAHYGGEHPKTLAWMAQQNVKVLNICVGGRSERWRKQAELYRRCAEQHPDRYAWVTSFTLPDFKDPKYAEKVIEDLKRDFTDGAVGCKVWKSVGMFIKKPDGAHLQIDDPIFEPIFSWLEAEGHTLVVHVADPIGRWRPLDEKDPYYDLYKKTPRGQMYGREGVPSHGEILASRDRVIERHPKLRVVGCHLGSMEHDLGELAKRFDKYPNFAVDTSGLRRITALAAHDREKVR